MVKSGYLAKVYGIDTSVAFSNSFTSEAMTEGNGDNLKIYQINDIGKRLWDPNEAIIIAGEGNPTLDKSWMDKGIDWFTGRVKLNETGLIITTSGKYFSTLIEIGNAYNWTLDLSIDIVDVSSFGDRWKKKKALQENWTGAFEKFAIDEYWFDIAKLAKIFLVKFYVEDNKGYKGFCAIPSLSSGASVTDVIRETVNLEGHWMLSEFDES